MDDLVGSVLYSIAELLSGLVNWVLRRLGFSEIEVKQLSVIVGWFFVAVGIVGLFWLTVSYS